MRQSAILCTLGFALCALAFAQPSVRVVAYGAEGRELRSGHGVALSGGHIVTARSVLMGARRVEVSDGSRPRQTVRWVVADNPGAGLIRLWVEQPFESVSEWRAADMPAAAKLNAGSQVLELKSVRDIPGSGLVAELNGTVPESLAGAPVTDSDGKVLGVLVPQFAGTRYVAFAVPIEDDKLKPQALRSIEEWANARNPEAEETYQLALGQIWTENYDSAARNLQGAVEAKPDFAEAWFHLGFAKGKLGRSAERISAYQRAIELQPDYAEAHYSLGVSLTLVGRRTEAMQQVRELRRIAAGNLADKLTRLLEAIHVDKLGEEHDAKPTI
ncbi:MAG: tetratricopeptide repeat protein [Bryobacteraceae bacterium]|nr:tetratricopeptide repeat protein [Bryobacteraceae bacterium]